jgi:hypothetical protein
VSIGPGSSAVAAKRKLIDTVNLWCRAFLDENRARPHIYPRAEMKNPQHAGTRAPAKRTHCQAPYFHTVRTPSLSLSRPMPIQRPARLEPRALLQRPLPGSAHPELSPGRKKLHALFSLLPPYAFLFSLAAEFDHHRFLVRILASTTPGSSASIWPSSMRLRVYAQNQRHLRASKCLRRVLDHISAWHARSILYTII